MAAMGAGPEKKPDEATSRRASWRGADRPGQTSAAERSWQRLPGGKRSPAELRRIRSRRLKLATFTSLLLVLGAAFIWQLRNAPSTTLIAVALTDYPPPLPPNAFALEDVTRFEAIAHQDPGTLWSRFGKSGGTLARDSHILKRDETALWDDAKALTQIEDLWKDARPGGPDRGWFHGGGTKVVYLSGHGTVDHEHHPCLILENRQRLNVDDLIKRLGGAPRGVHTLLIVDANRSVAHWPAGMLYNGFAEAIEASDALKEADSVAVLLSAGPGETAWAAPERQDTPFGRFVGEALAGARDADCKTHDGKISVTELHQFVERQVRNWVATKRYAHQSPVLYPEDRDFQVVFVGKPSPVPPHDQQFFYFADQSVKDDWDQLDALWKLNKGSEPKEDEARTPLWYEHCLDWHRFEQGMVRCEQFLLAGSAYKDKFREEFDAMKALAQHLQDARDREPPLHTLAAVRIWRTSGSDRHGAEEFGRRFYAPEGEPPPDVPTDYYPQAGDAWRFLRTEADESKLDGAKILKALALVKQPPDGKAAPAELQLLRLLAGKPDRPWTIVSEEVWTAPNKPAAKALELRELAEQTITVEDPRAHYAIRFAVDLSDEKMRALEDSLFTGDPQLPPDAADTYKKEQQRSQDLARCFATRDRSWAWLPYLTEWSLRVPEDDSLVDLAARVLDRTAELDHLLADSLAKDARSKGEKESAQPLDLDALKEAEADVSAGLSSLKTKLRSFADAALADRGQPDAVKLRDIEAALTNPLVDWQQRKDLREYVGRQAPEATSSARTSSTARKSDQEDETELPHDVPQPYFLDRLVAWWGKCEHPDLIFADVDTSDVDTGKKRAPDWRYFADRQERLTQSKLDALKADPLAGANIAGVDRKKLSEKEAPLRRAAALCALPMNRGKMDAIQRLTQFDRNALLMWQAKRRLDDFWGPDDDGRSYFALAFDECHKAADEFAHDFADRWDDLIGVRDERLKALQSPLLSESNADPFRLIDNRTFNANLNLTANRLPKGAAAISVWEPSKQPTQIERTDGTGQIPGHPRDRLASFTEPHSEPLSLRVSRIAVPKADPLPAGVSNWPLAWVFRGHDHEIDLPVKKLGPPIELVYDWKPSDTASVAVEGEIKEAAVVFILDCSASMNEPASVLVDGKVKRGNRMLAATVTLRRIIDRLTHAGRPDVGLWLYGHRMGINGSGVFVPNEKQAWTVPPSASPNLRPGDDVECEATMGPLNEARIARINTVLTSAQPWGMTPLYLAMVQALDDFRLAPVRGPRRLIVITDGVNVQVDANAKKPTTLSPTDTTAVKTKLKGIAPPVRIELLFCGSDNDPKTAQERKALDDLKQLIHDVGGEFTPVVDWINLEQNLQDVLGLKEFEVQRKDKRSSTVTKKQQPIGTRVTLNDDFVPGNPVDYDVRIVGQEGVHSLVRLEGGEALTLELRAGGQLVHESYLPDEHLKPRLVANLQSKVSDADPRDFRVFAYPPQPRADGRLRFSLSVQNGDSNKFSPRPREAWIEITPVGDRGESDFPYYYPCYDLAFEPVTPVPVLYCDVPKWPPGATSAKIKLWFKLYPTSMTAMESVAKRISDCVEADGPAPAERGAWLPGVKIRVTVAETPQKCELIVEEEHVDKGPPQWARIEVELPDPPESINRKFDHEAKMAWHHFHFNTIRSQVVKGTVRVTAGEAVRNGAMAVVDPPMQVTIPDRLGSSQ
jgi:hypothetical protein